MKAVAVVRQRSGGRSTAALMRGMTISHAAWAQIDFPQLPAMPCALQTSPKAKA